MLKSLFPLANWDNIQAVGFDLDGTLYDEYDFIVQVYQPISARLADSCRAPASEIYDFILKRWLEKGSSYNRIFDEVLDLFEAETPDKEGVIADCLKIFRGYDPKLTLTARAASLLNHFASQFKLFLVTDGNCDLQQKKIASLGLGRWFQIENIAISGCLGVDCNKPSLAMLQKISVLKNVKAEEVVFFGDREIDRDFALNAGFLFYPVEVMIASLI